jgi:hypothetical protein
VSYLAAATNRREAFKLLKSTVGTDPRTILEAPPPLLEQVTSHSIIKGTFADKLRGCPAPISRNREAGDESNPFILRPSTVLAPESNGLRALPRLDIIAEEYSHVRIYAASLKVTKGLFLNPESAQEAHLLLQEHGQTLCRHSN